MEWRLDRCGCASASRFKDIIAKGRGGGEAISRRNYRAQLAIERLTGFPLEEPYQNAAMEHGKLYEPVARMEFEAATGEIVMPVGFIKHPTIEQVGCSPDGLIGDDDGIEIKCPYVPAIHLETITSKEIPSEYIAQVQGAMWVTGRKQWTFVSYSPVFPEHLRLFIRHVTRDDIFIRHLHKDVIQFLSEVEEVYASLLKEKK